MHKKPHNTDLPEAGKSASDLYFDASVIQTVFGGDTIYAEEIFSLFLREIPSEYKALADAYKGGRLAEVARIAHKMKPNFGMVGLPLMENYLGLVEFHIQETPDVQKLAEAVGMLESFYPQALQLIETVRLHLNKK